MCGAPGASVGANTRQWGVESRQGAENSALKNIAPFNRTPFNTSENASILFRLPPDARQTFVASVPSILSPPDSRSRTSTVRAWSAGQRASRIAGVVRRRQDTAGNRKGRDTVRARHIIYSLDGDAPLLDGPGDRFSGYAL